MAAMPKERDIFVWTDGEIKLLLECVKAFASVCLYESKDLEGIKSKYDEIRVIFVERYPKADDEGNVDESFDHVCKCCHHRKENVH